MTSITKKMGIIYMTVSKWLIRLCIIYFKAYKLVPCNKILNHCYKITGQIKLLLKNKWKKGMCEKLAKYMCNVVVRYIMYVRVSSINDIECSIFQPLISLSSRNEFCFFLIYVCINFIRQNKATDNIFGIILQNWQRSINTI